MAISYEILSRVVYRLFGECSTERDFFSSAVWLYIRRNGFAFRLGKPGLVEVNEMMDDLRDIYESIKLFEAGDVLFG